jgi:hypothetical protein
VDRVVQLPVPALVQPVPATLTRGRFDRRGAGVAREVRVTSPTWPMINAATTTPTPRMSVNDVADAATAGRSRFSDAFI